MRSESALTPPPRAIEWRTSRASFRQTSLRLGQAGRGAFEMMRFGSVCSGIEAASAAWLPLGWRCQFMSEIEAFPRAVLSHHYPETPLHGDFTTIRADDYGPVDVLVGGTPCQSFSVAGLRGGMADARGNLALEYLRLAERLRPRWIVWENVPGVLSSADGRDFGSFVGGLAECGYGWAYRILDAQYFGLAQRRKRVFVVGYLGDWRRAAAVLFEPESLRGHPAPRREARERVANAITERPDRGGGNSEGQRLIASTLQAALGRRNGQPNDHDPAGGLVAHCLNAHGGSGRIDAESETFVTHAFDARMSDVIQYGNLSGPLDTCGHSIGVTHSLRADGFDASEDGTGRGTPLVAFAQNQRDEVRQMDVAGALSERSGITANQQTYVDTSAVYNQSETFDDKGIRQGIRHASPSQTNARALLLRVRQEIGAEAFAEWGLGILNSFHPAKILQPKVHGQEFRQTTFSRSWMVCCSLGSPFTRAEGALQSLREACGERCPPQGWESLKQLADELGAYLSELSQPGAQAERFMHDLWQADEGPWILRQALSEVQKVWRSSRNESQPTQSTSAVRRLTATECEFLQGFPRNYTLIPYRGKPAADGPRYRALGNSMAVPCMRWIGERIEAAS